jgi:hypothetical protein
VILIVLIASFFCTKEERNTVIKNELTKNNPQIEVTTSNEEVKPTTVYRMFGYNSSYLKSEWNSYLEDKMDNLRAMRCQ